MYPRLPRIDLDDLLKMIEKSIEIHEENVVLNQPYIANHFIFIDCRNKDEISTFGPIANSLKLEEFINSPDLQTRNSAKAKSQSTLPQANHHFKHHLVIVVNSIETSMLLIENYSVPRVCYLELNKLVPKLLQTPF